MNKKLRLKIVELIKNSGEGHIPSSFSIVDILDCLYKKFFKKKINNTYKRNFFILSKGHGCVALYVVLNKYGYLSKNVLESYGKKNSRLGGHPDMTKITSVEASTGSLGHGFPTAVGIALAMKIKKIKKKVFVLIGDGECHEGSIWEAANIAANRNLDNICAIIDLNKSAQQLMPIDNMQEKWKAFGWNVITVDGHSKKSIDLGLKKMNKFKNLQPVAIIANTVKGKGVSFIEGHGIWHHKIPNKNEMNLIREELK